MHKLCRKNFPARQKIVKIDIFVCQGTGRLGSHNNNQRKRETHFTPEISVAAKKVPLSVENLKVIIHDAVALIDDECITARVH